MRIGVSSPGRNELAEHQRHGQDDEQLVRLSPAASADHRQPRFGGDASLDVQDVTVGRCRRPRQPPQRSPGRSRHRRRRWTRRISSPAPRRRRAAPSQPSCLGLPTGDRRARTHGLDTPYRSRPHLVARGAVGSTACVTWLGALPSGSTSSLGAGLRPVERGRGAATAASVVTSGSTTGVLCPARVNALRTPSGEAVAGQTIGVNAPMRVNQPPRAARSANERGARR